MAELYSILFTDVTGARVSKTGPALEFQHLPPPSSKTLLNPVHLYIKVHYSEKATKFCKISTVDLFCVVAVKSTVEVSQNSVAFSEYMNFILNSSKKRTKNI